LFLLKIAFSGRGTLAGTMWAHFNCNDKKAEKSVGTQSLQEDRRHDKNTEQTRQIEKTTTHKFFSPLVGKHREQPRRRPRVGRPPDRLCHAALDLKGRREAQSSHNPCPGGPIGRHLAKMKRSSLVRHDSSNMVLPEDFRQRDPGSSEAPQHRLLILEDSLLLRLRGGRPTSSSATPRWSSRCTPGA
jgi:hypothetical protein